MALNIQQREMDDVIVLEVIGRITIGRDCQELEWKLQQLATDGSLRLVVDLANVSHVDSTGIGIFVMSSGKFKAAGGQLRLAAPNAIVDKVFTITAVNTIIPIHVSVAEAVAAFNSRAAGA